MKANKKTAINILFLIAALVVNYLGATGYINGMSQSDVSNKYFTLITPSGTTFSIWGLIYSLLILSLIVMYWRRKDDYYQSAIDHISVPLLVTFIANMTWIILFSFELIWLSSLAILIYTVALAIICRRLLAIHDGDHFLLPATFGIYTGWLMIATVVNIAAALVKSGWKGSGLSDASWALIVLVVAVLLVIFVTYRTENAVLPLPVAWAYYGIYQNLVDAYDEYFTVLKITAIVGLVILIAMSGIQFYRNRYGVLPRVPDPDVKVRRDS